MDPILFFSLIGLGFFLVACCSSKFLSLHTPGRTSINKLDIYTDDKKNLKTDDLPSSPTLIIEELEVRNDFSINIS